MNLHEQNWSEDEEGNVIPPIQPDEPLTFQQAKKNEAELRRDHAAIAVRPVDDTRPNVESARLYSEYVPLTPHEREIGRAAIRQIRNQE